jgi:hypothetical protein
MWIRSESAYETLVSMSSENPPTQTWRANTLIFDNGRVWISHDVITAPTITNVNRIRFGRSLKSHGSLNNVHTAWFYHGRWNNVGWMRTVLVIRLWIVMLLLALPPALWLYRWWRKPRRLEPGHCPTCGYDLRATPDRCPECGTPIPTSATPAG